MAEVEGITPRLGGEAWVLTVRALVARRWLTGAFVVLTALMFWLEAALGGDDDRRGMIVGDLLPSVVELLLAASLMIAVHRAVLLDEPHSPPPWRALRMHGVFMAWLLALGVLEDGVRELMARVGTGAAGLLADAGLLVLAVYGAARLSLLFPTVALTGSGDWLSVRGAWGLSRHRVLAIVVTATVTGAPLLGVAIVLMVLGPWPPPLSWPPAIFFVLAALVRAVVLAVAAAVASLLFLACSRLQAYNN